MNYPDFVKIVKEMREEQKRYFATRSQAALFNAKDLEKKVDKQIEEFSTSCHAQ